MSQTRGKGTGLKERLLGLFRQDREGCVIDWERVRRIGDDVILVEVDADRGC